MHVMNRLTAVVAGVQYSAISSFRHVLRPSYVPSREHHLAQHVSVAVPRHLERCDVLRGDDEDVDRGLWADVVKSEHILRTMYDVGRDLARDDPAEETVGDTHETIRQKRRSRILMI
jgi:hypothetical protein